MPPAWTPEKRNANEYEELNEIGYVTPPRPKTSPEVAEKGQPTNREDRHIKWLLHKIPQLANIFKLHKQIGEGTFSAVFLATLLNDYEQSKLFAVKHLVPTTHPKRIGMELTCLKTIGGEDNVAGVDLCIRENENIVFIMPYMRHEQFIDYVADLDAKETANYIKNLLLAVRRVHSFNIIHRDIKPNNFLYDRKNKRFLLVDFGLSQTCPSKCQNDDEKVSQKRKREIEIVTKDKQNEFCEPAPKRQALYKKNTNMNNLLTTVKHLQNTSTKIISPASKHKENIQSYILKSPLKSPMKNISTKIMKSPYKFTGLDLPPNHSKLIGKMPGQRRLFMDSEETKNIKFQKPAATVSISKRLPEKNISPIEKRTSATHRNLTEDCKCFNKPSVCTVCLVRKAQEAPRAGTPGFRPPEVLLKHSKQTTAVDMWAVGVILLCILSGTYPFFRAPDDVTALGEIITLFGDQSIKKVAKLFGRHFISSEKKSPLDIRKVCCKLRNRGKNVEIMANKRCENCKQFEHNCLCIGSSIIDEKDDMFPVTAYDLLKRLLDVDPYTRITAEDALKHPFLNAF